MIPRAQLRVWLILRRLTVDATVVALAMGRSGRTTYSDWSEARFER